MPITMRRNLPAIAACPCCGRPMPMHKTWVDPGARRLYNREKSVHVRPSGVKLVAALLRSKGEYVSNEALWNALWPEDDRPRGKALDVQVHKLAKQARKIGLDIRTGWGWGRALVEVTGERKHERCAGEGIDPRRIP